MLPCATPPVALLPLSSHRYATLVYVRVRTSPSSEPAAAARAAARAAPTARWSAATRKRGGQGRKRGYGHHQCQQHPEHQRRRWRRCKRRHGRVSPSDVQKRLELDQFRRERQRSCWVSTTRRPSSTGGECRSVRRGPAWGKKRGDPVPCCFNEFAGHAPKAGVRYAQIYHPGTHCVPRYMHVAPPPQVQPRVSI